MRITLQMEGGVAVFPGLNRAVTVDTASLSAEEARTIEACVESSRFFEGPHAVSPGMPAVIGAGSPGADRRRYSLRVEDGERVQTLHLHEPIPEPLRALVDHAQRITRAARGNGEKP